MLVQYTDVKTSKQRKIAVRKLKLKADSPLQTQGARTIHHVRETVCSLEIVPKIGNYSLILGFPSLDGIKSTYHDLGGENPQPGALGVS